MTDTAIRLLLEFDDQVRRDREQPPTFLHRRDRKYAMDCHKRGITPSPRHWLAHLARLSGQAGKSSADAALGTWRHIMMGFILAGSAFGVVTMLGLLFYEGGQRINVTVILAVAFLQLLLAGVTTLQAFAGWQPWRPLLTRFSDQRSNAVLRKLQPQLMARAAHVGGLAFGTCGLLTLLVMVVVQDLAFGWSTTLNTDSHRFLGLVQAISAPWHWLWPTAVPDASLVETTRFFRAQAGAITLNPARLGDWWPFVAMVWAFYVLLPRLVLAIIADGHLRFRASRLLKRHPGLTAWQYRMETPALETGNAHNDAEHQPDTSTNSQLKPLPESDTVICWAGAGEPELPDALNGPDTLVLRAGGRASLQDDTITLAKAADHLAHITRPAVIVVTRGWEPPTGELQDFLQHAREQWPRASHVAVVPLTTSGLDEPPAHQLQQWLRFTERLGTDFACVSLPPLLPQNPYHQREQ
ncbi:DUF2868 domain-containing protein [Marinobacter sp. NP-4(2019)]|uniref:DUF2868 domain-containing protein n=1 Tax=Marinobacter sp. NP-4(2019) TaxID=2488665 RepID=UPI000FC3E7F5|nr:DUF2868 domain-containing protein [Marinobacter sp. NP-4(2019)]AZT82150.1 DUF2868 domain-containing protein [Marinobacter sp. NP-4(2019)]